MSAGATHWGSYVPPRGGLLDGKELDLGAEPDDRVVPNTGAPAPDVVDEHGSKPRHTFEVSDGWLLGFDRGEWGGEGIFRGVDGKQEILLKDNVFAFFKLGEVIVAVTGLAHMGSDHGTPWRVSRIDGKWRATPWLQLPGDPTAARLVEGRLVIATWREVVAVDAAGAVVVLPCR